MIETDAKSLNSLSNASGHSRKSSNTSQISVTSGTSSGQGQDSTAEPEEDAWVVWGRVVNEWDFYWKKKQQQVKVGGRGCGDVDFVVNDFSEGCCDWTDV